MVVSRKITIFRNHVTKQQFLFLFIKFLFLLAMLPAARDPRFQNEDITIFMEHIVWNCVKMSIILLFYYVETHSFSNQTWIIFEIHLV